MRRVAVIWQVGDNLFSRNRGATRRGLAGGMRISTGTLPIVTLVALLLGGCAHYSALPLVQVAPLAPDVATLDIAASRAPLSVSQVVDLALANNPDLKAARLKRAIAAGQVKQAKGNEDAARQNLIVVTNQAISDVGQAYVDLQSSLQRLDIASAGVANALELVRIDEGRYVGGIGQFLDVTTAQASLFTAQLSLSQAQGDVERSRASLRTAIGLL